MPAITAGTRAAQMNGLDGLFDEILDGTVSAELSEPHNEHVVFVATFPVGQWHGSLNQAYDRL